MHQGITDDLIQRDQDQQGNKAPQAAAEHGGTLTLVQRLDLLLLLCGIILVLVLQLLDQRGDAGHFHHAALALCAEGQQDQLDDDGEQDQSQAVVGGEPVQQIHDPAKGSVDQMKLKKHGHFLLGKSVAKRIFA